MTGQWIVWFSGVDADADENINDNDGADADADADADENISDNDGADVDADENINDNDGTDADADENINDDDDENLPLRKQCTVDMPSPSSHSLKRLWIFVDPIIQPNSFSVKTIKSFSGKTMNMDKYNLTWKHHHLNRKHCKNCECCPCFSLFKGLCECWDCCSQLSEM